METLRATAAAPDLVPSEADRLAAVTRRVVHQLNNRLAVVLANAELIAARLPPDASESLRDLEDLRIAAKSGADLVRHLLGASADVPLMIEPVDVASPVRNACRTLAHTLPPSIELECLIAHNLPLTAADAGAVEFIVAELAANAQEAMLDGGVLRIEVRPAKLGPAHRLDHPWIEPGTYTMLRVSDTGQGMTAGVRARLFKPLFTAKPVGNGSGLGLKLVAELAGQHGGAVDVESEVGVGTIVRVFFPIAAALRRTAAPGAPDARSPRTVLFVEDEDTLRKSGGRLLEQMGYRVRLATDGLEALAAFDGSAPPIDIVVADQHMPRLDGLGLYRALRERGTNVPFVLSSGLAASHSRSQAFGAETQFLQKPWTGAELAAAVTKALRAQRPAAGS